MTLPKARQCPADPACGTITGWDAFLRHLMTEHADGTPEERMAAVQDILTRRHPPSDPALLGSPVVPKVTARPETAVLHAVLTGDVTRAREIVGTLGSGERQAFIARLTQIIDMLWGERL